jgi:nicotinamidase-related amidase
VRRKVSSGAVEKDGLFFEGTFGAAIVDALTPLQGEPVLDKRGRSAFFGTGLHSALVEKGVDTCVIVGGSTSGCIRPTACDAEQHGFSVIIPEEAVFDRFAISHTVNLFDLQRAQADVMPVAELLSKLPARG